VARLEQELEQLARERVEQEHSLAAPETYRPEARAGLQIALARQAELVRLSATAEAAWIEASAGLEAAMAGNPKS